MGILRFLLATFRRRLPPTPAPPHAPPLPIRCGTFLMPLSGDDAKAVVRGWREAEERYIARTTTHPNPPAECIQTVALLGRRHEDEDVPDIGERT